MAKRARQDVSYMVRDDFWDASLNLAESIAKSLRTQARELTTNPPDKITQTYARRHSDRLQRLWLTSQGCEQQRRLAHIGERLEGCVGLIGGFDWTVHSLQEYSNLHLPYPTTHKEILWRVTTSKPSESRTRRSGSRSQISAFLDRRWYPLRRSFPRDGNSARRNWCSAMRISASTSDYRTPVPVYGGVGIYLLQQVHSLFESK